MERLTGFKVREAVSVLLGYTVDPARNGKTNRQHIPDTQEEMTDRINVVNTLNQEACTDHEMATVPIWLATEFKV